MKLLKHYILFSCLLIIYCHALSCRSKYGLRDERLKRVFNDCLEQQSGNSSDRYDQERRERSNYRNDNERDGDERRRDNTRDNYDGSYGRNRGQDEKRENGQSKADERNKMSNSNRLDASRVRNDMNRNGRLSGQDEFLQSEEYGNQYYSSPQSNGRYKREKRVEMNSGQRSQYNPHSRNSNGNKDDSNEKSNKEVACVLHCFLENLQMTGEDGMPDRYLMTHALTKDERNEDLRDFLQESVEECFQILDNENTEDKCEFSKNLWMCLSEKGKANCDDWPDKSSFMI